MLVTTFELDSVATVTSDWTKARPAPIDEAGSNRDNTAPIYPTISVGSDAHDLTWR